MPRNGSGTFALVYDWEDDDANDIPIQSDRFMGQEQDIADGLTASIAKDGQTVPTANLPMGGFKQTGVALATAADDYLRADQLQKGTLNSFTATGTDTYVITPSPVVSAYALYQSWRVLFTNGNTGAATLNVNGIGAKNLTKRGAVALVAGDIPAGAVADVCYDGTQFQILNVAIEPIFFIATGTDTYAVTASPVLTAYTAGLELNVLFTNANTGAATLNVNTLGAKALTKLGSTALGAGDLPAGYVAKCIYDGTRFQTSSPGSSVSLGLPAGAAQTVGFTAAVNTKYVVNFTANGTITFPAAASTGDIIVLALGGNYAYTFAPNGLKINASSSNLVVPGNQTVIMMYTGATNGWV